MQQLRILRHKFNHPTWITKLYSSSSGDPSELPVNLLEEKATAHLQPTTGKIYDVKPFKIRLQANKKYMWCSCGQSHTQPFCDGTHKTAQLKITLRPVRLMVAEEKDYWLCNCKQTKRRPFCDGSHKSEEVQAAKK